MSTTPGAKLSPFGNSIRKTLLTPCRRVGLSRKTKTPNSIKLMSQNINNSSSSSKLSDQSSDVTPVNKKTSIKRKSLVEFDNSLEKSSKFADNGKSEPTAKKSLNKCFSNKEIVSSKNNLKRSSKKCKNIIENEENIDNKRKVRNKMITLNANSEDNVEDSLAEDKEQYLQPNGEEKVSKTLAIKTIAQIHVDSIEDGLNCKGDILIDNDYFKKDVKENFSDKKTINSCVSEGKNSNSSTNSSPVVKKSHRNRILSDSDDDFIDSPTQKPKFNKSGDKKILVEKNESYNTGISVIMKNCKVSLTKYSEEDVFLETKSEEDLDVISDEEFIKSVKKKKKIMLSDSDDDFCPNNSTKTNKTAKEMKLKIKTSSESSTTKILPTQNTIEDTKLKSKSSSKTLVSKFSSLADYEDDDAFTSTPDREKNEKKELIDKIKDLESKIKVRKQKLDNLNRASVYKSKHNIDDLEKLTQTWRQGCILGLNELLQKLQTHGSIEMSTLLKNLRLPDEMVAKIFVAK